MGDLIYDALGALFLAFIIFNICYVAVSKLNGYKMPRNKNVWISFLISIVITLILGLVLGYNVIKIHIPMLTLYFAVEYTKANYIKCPECAEKIKASAKKCKHCHSEILKSGRTEEIA